MEISQVPFLDVLKDITSKYNKIPNKYFSNVGDYAIIDQSVGLIAGFTNDESEVTNIGYPVIIFGDHTRILKYIDFPFAIGADGVKVLSVNTEIAYPKYIFYFLKFLKIPNAGYSRHFKFLKEKKVVLPKSLDDQKRIAKVLSQCEGLIEKRKESIALLEELLKSTFFEMFGERKGRKVLLNEIVDIQEGLVNPNEEPYNEMYHVGGANIESNTGKLINLKKAKDENLISGKYLFEPNYILYSKIRPYLNKVALVDFTGICSADIYPLKPKNPDECNVQFLRFELQSQQFLTHANNNSDRANIPKINRKALNGYSTILPDNHLQIKFAQIVEKVESLKKQYTESLKELKNLYASLSQRAFKGELDLSKVIITDIEEIKKKDPEEMKDDLTEEQMEKLITSFEHTLPSGEVPTDRTTDIHNLTIRQYLNMPEYDEATDGVEFSFMNKDFFYQFILTQGFVDRTFSLDEVEQYARKYILGGTGFEFTYENWKTIIFRFLGAKQPILEQVLEEYMEGDRLTKSIKLKLTDEAYQV